MDAPRRSGELIEIAGPAGCGKTSLVDALAARIPIHPGVTPCDRSCIPLALRLLPLLPAKQRSTHENDWMTTDMDIAGPDPNCGARYRITRTKKRVFRHHETSAVPLAGKDA